MTEQTPPAEATLSAFFETLKNEGARDLRAAAWETFSHKGLPNRRVESWRYTDLKQALRKIAPLAESRAASAPERASGGARLVVLDGAFRPDLSDLSALPEGATVQSLRDALAQGDAAILAALAPERVGGDDAAVALNAALMQDGVVLRLAAGAKVNRAIEIATGATGAGAAFARSLVIVGEGASATIVETATGADAAGAQENNALVFALAAGAHIRHAAFVAPASADAVRVISLLASLQRGSALCSYCLVEGGGLLRRQLFAHLAGEGARLSVCGASLLRGRAHADTSLFVDHLAPRCESRERFRHILDGAATGVFQGKVVVRPGAQKTDGAMQSKALLLSDAATMNNKPELEIYADDVACGHGATCGRLDADQLFYLQTRGVPRKEAEALLMEGFADEAFEALDDETLREAFVARVGRWLASRGEQR